MESQSELRTESEGGISLSDVTEPAATRTRRETVELSKVNRARSPSYSLRPFADLGHGLRGELCPAQGG